MDNDSRISAAQDTRNLIDKYKGLSVATIKQDVALHSLGFHVAIENPQHDINIGSIVRSANAFGAAAVHIIGKKHWNRRGAMATEKYLELYHHSSVNAFIEWSTEQGAQLIGVDNIAGCTWLEDYAINKDRPFTILVFGQEGPGLSEEIKPHCSAIIGIKQYGSTRSINIAAAAAIILHSWAHAYKK
jgi:tRNA G18 (ribose-2'-O)-methylase SpoU